MGTDYEHDKQRNFLECDGILYYQIESTECNLLRKTKLLGTTMNFIDDSIARKCVIREKDNTCSYQKNKK